MAKDLRPVYIAPTETAANARYDEFVRTLGRPVSGDRCALGAGVVGVRALPRLRRRHPLRRLFTNAIESLNACYRRATCVRGHFPTERASLK
ncbi:hypothetical protein GCM10009772_05090 [Pseudonocardia alni subsp. carboxydivorans]